MDGMCFLRRENARMVALPSKSGNRRSPKRLRIDGTKKAVRAVLLHKGKYCFAYAEKEC
jgi:hypothetical protein